jgi:glycine/D-amino acid oxidase-like deaminating enzyme
MAHDTADIAIVGGGIMGLSIAYQVARRSSKRVIVLEKGAGLGEGSTGGSAAITRQRYSRPEQIRLARDGNAVFRNWAEYTGLASPLAEYHQSGVLWMLCETRESAERDRDRMRAEGVDAIVIGAEEVRERFPALSACQEPFDLTGSVEHVHRDGDAFLLELDSGYFDATAALEDVAAAARREGAEVRMQSRVTGVAHERGRVAGIGLADGSVIDAGMVVNAAGPWCNEVNAMAGLDLEWDLIPTRVQVVYRDLPEEVPRPLPVVGDGSTGIYLRPESAGQQILMGSILEEDEQEAADPETYSRVADRDFVDLKIHALHHRIPSLPYRGKVGGMAGMYTINLQDVHPVIGPTSLKGFAVANGFSGHGFKESQMVGSMMARWLTGETSTFDTEVPMEFFSFDRDPIELDEKTVLA